jgi:hypothetical protein
MRATVDLSRLVITFLEEREELAKIEAVFTELKGITWIKKTELYGKALEWMAKDKKSKEKFIEHLSKKAQEEQLIISK